MVKPKQERETIEVPSGIATSPLHSRCMALIWWMIDWWNQDEQGWCKIHGDYFEKITTDDETRTKSKKFLIDNGYMEKSKYVVSVGA